MSFFVEAYPEKTTGKCLWIFADISHYSIEILEFPTSVRESYRVLPHEVMVDEYQDTNHIRTDAGIVV